MTADSPDELAMQRIRHMAADLTPTDQLAAAAVLRHMALTWQPRSARDQRIHTFLLLACAEMEHDARSA